MRKSKTVKKEFYLLVVKIFIFTFISSIAAYLGLYFHITVSIGKTSKESDFYVKYIEAAEKEIKNNPENILKGNILDLSLFNEELEGEVVDLNGKHLYGENNIYPSEINVLKSINSDIVKDRYIYRYIGIMESNSIKAIYIIKAPFGYTINNLSENPIDVILFWVLILSPIIFFILYIFIFTSKLYKSLYNNITIILNATDKISNGYYNHSITGLKGSEFVKIQDAFNTMTGTVKENIDSLNTIDQERRMMVSSIAHDIRTPITVVKGQLELISKLKDIDGFNMDENINIINNSCKRMVTLTDNLSLLYKVESMDFLLKNENLNLKNILIEKEKEIKSFLYNRNIEINFTIKLSKEKYILDESMIIRVLDNILYNSIRFTKKGEINLVVYDNMESKKIYFKCIDTGKGFKQKNTEDLFKAFYQDEDYKNHFGLGLYISKKIVENFQGEISAYNNTNGGATLEFFIKESEDYVKN
ncbi:HAMP domain-containing histidine kinase [Clostridium sardiniense]